MNKKATNSLDKIIGSRIRARRLSVGISQERLSSLLGITFQQVQKYENGINRVTASRLVEIASILGNDANALLNLDTPSINLPAVIDSAEVRQLLKHYAHLPDHAKELVQQLCSDLAKIDGAADDTVPFPATRSPMTTLPLWSGWGGARQGLI